MHVQLAGHGVTLHLIKGRPLRASLDLTDIRPADDHTSFQVGLCILSSHLSSVTHITMCLLCSHTCCQP